MSNPAPDNDMTDLSPTPSDADQACATAARTQRRSRIPLILLGLAGAAVAVLAVLDHVQVILLRNALRSDDPAARLEAIHAVADRREERLAAAMFALIEKETERGVLEQAAYSAMRTRDRRGVHHILNRAEHPPDDVTRAKLIIFAARLANRDARLMPWLEDGIASPETWRRVGSGVGMLQLGQPRGGDALIAMAPSLDDEARTFALDEFRRIAVPMAEAVGYPIDLDDPDRGDPWAQLDAFWREQASIMLLNDILTRLRRFDPKWHEVNRLLHARERVARWFE